MGCSPREQGKQHWANPTEGPGKANDSTAKSLASFPSTRIVIKLERAECLRRNVDSRQTQSMRGLGLVGDLRGPEQKSRS